VARAVAAGLVAWALSSATPADAQDLEELLGGFEEEEEAPVEEVDEPDGSPLRGRFWELTGSVSVAGSVNLLSHRSASGNTNYQGLSKLRNRLNLQLDVDLPKDWELRAQGFAYYDWAYRIRGRSEYTSDVLRKYEWDADTQDLWIRGSPWESFDVKLGRQVVSWGRSETLRVLDVLNPLDNREPGIADIEDLRRSVTMGRFDYYFGDWNLSLVAIPEIRFNQNPVPGSDFSPVPDGSPDVDEKKPDSLEHWEAGASLTGIFPSWDVSFHFAYFYDDLAVLESFALPLVSKHHRLWLVGSGGNYTWGSWLFKGEIAFLDGLGFTDASNKSRLDVMGGVEYYGFADTTIAIEVLNRHTFDFPATLSVATNLLVPQEDETQAAFRLTRSFLNERLEGTVVAVLFSGDPEVGSVVRIDANYELRDALVLTGGFVLYQEGDVPPLSTWGDNDRFFFELKYSF
jgi:hypothetical protein